MKKIIEPKIKFTNYYIEESYEYSIDNKEFDQNNITSFHDVTFNSCIFSKIDFSDIKLTNVEFIDCIFNDCDLSNKSFSNVGIHRVIFNNSKLIGVSFSEINIKNVKFNTCNLRYSNFYMVNVDNLLFDECMMDESYFTECNFKNIYFDKCSLNKVTILNLEHNGFDLSNSSIDDVNFDLKSLKGISVNMIQGAMLSRYLGIIIKD